MRIGSLALGKVFLAPLSGVGDSPFRRICKRFGAAVTYSEMVSSEGLIRGSLKSQGLLRFHDEERPLGIQVFGSNPGTMAHAAVLVGQQRPDFIDLNLCCPARKIVSKGAGCALLRDVSAVGRVAASVVAATDLPVTAKIRLGWDEASINAGEVAHCLEEAGVAAICVHGRTWKQGFRGRSSWEQVAKVKDRARVPVILSGDVTSPEEAGNAFDETGCDAVMVGRGALGRPWLFTAIRDYLTSGSYRDWDCTQTVRVVLDHLDLGIAEFGEQTAVVRFRKHLLWYTKGIPGVVALRPAMSTVSTRQQVTEVLGRVLPDRSRVRDGHG